MIEPVYVPYEQYRAAKTGCGLDSRIYGIYYTFTVNSGSYFSFCNLKQSKGISAPKYCLHCTPRITACTVCRDTSSDSSQTSLEPLYYG
jgi:hypothetical protein